MPQVNLFEAIQIAIRHQQAGQLDQAETLYRKVLQHEPAHAQAIDGLTGLLRQTGRGAAVIEVINRAIAATPGVAALHEHLADAYWTLSRFEEVAAALQRAVELDSTNLQMWNKLAIALASQDRMDQAVAAVRRAIALQPDSAASHQNLGTLLQAQGQIEASVEAFKRAITLNPADPISHSGLGTALIRQDNYAAAIECFGKAVALQPSSALAQNNIGLALQHCGLVEEGIAHLRRAVEIQPDFVGAHSNLLLALNYGSGDPTETFVEHRRWANAHVRQLVSKAVSHGNERHPDRPLRIGYVSPDFKAHSVAFFIEALLARHDKGKFYITCYSDLARGDEVTQRLRGYPNQWRDIANMPHAQLMELIRKDQIDILIDLAGHTDGNRLLAFAGRPAPVQVTYLGYPNTTGLQQMDYRLTDAWADPPGQTEALHTEQLLRMPRTAWCFRPPDACPDVGPLPADTSKHVTFGSFNNLAKISNQAVELWCRILRAVPGARLILKSIRMDDPIAQDRLRRVFAEHGVVEPRVKFLAPEALRVQHLQMYHRVDVSLDTFPYHGTTTTCEALYMGVPVVSLAGKTHVSRVGVSILTNVGLSDLVAQAPEQYVRIAVGLAEDRVRLANLRAGLRQRMETSPLMDEEGFTREMEQAYRGIWRTWCEKAPPQ